MLEEHGLVDVHRTMASGVAGSSAFSFTTTGFEMYASNFIDDYDDIVKLVVGELVNSQRRSDREVAGATSLPRVVVEHTFDGLAYRGLLRVSKTTGPNSFVVTVSPQLGRMLADSS